MAVEEESFGEEPRRRRWPWLFALALFVFGGGMATMAWAMLHWAPLDRFLHERFARRPPIIVPMLMSPPAKHAAAGSGVAPAELAAQMATLSREVAIIDARTRAARGDADRAAALLVAFAARRALDRGVPLGYIEALLRGRFGQGQPQAVAAILAASHQPVTLVWLQSELDRIAPLLDARAGPTDWWTAVRREIAGLIVVRRVGEQSSDPLDRIGRARRALQAGQVDAALAEVARLPNTAAAAPWITAARRYLAARAALDRIETAALLEPVPPLAAPPPPPSAGAALPKS